VLPIKYASDPNLTTHLLSEASAATPDTSKDSRPDSNALKISSVKTDYLTRKQSNSQTSSDAETGLPRDNSILLREWLNRTLDENPEYSTLEVGSDIGDLVRSDGSRCRQRVESYLTPVNTALVMGLGSIATGFGAGLAENQANQGEYAGTQFVAGALTGVVGLLIALPSAIRWTVRGCPDCTLSRMTQLAERAAITTVTVGLLGTLGYCSGLYAGIVIDGRN
jgi:hypothetical protein